MSDGIYDDVISTESKRTEKQRMEMMVAIYESADGVRDQDFRIETITQQPLQNTGSDNVKMRSSRSALVCLVLLCFLLLTAVIVLCVHNTNYTEERNQLLTRITNITEERDEHLSRNTNLREEIKQLLNNNTSVFQLNAKLNREKHKLVQCFHGKGVCEIHQSSLYFISSEKKNWTESRRDCQQRGGDLIIINNREEQDNIQDVIEKMCDDKVWIGLTDSEEEGRWKWIDGSNMTSGFWRSGEPNGGRGENCALIHKSKWFDYPCNHTFKWICEIFFP